MAAEKLQIFKCEVCGNVVEVVHGGIGELVCCNEPMKLYEENTVDAAVEKHVPVKEDAEHGIKVKVGSVEHPMTEEHHIEWIEVISGDKAYREFLQVGAAPEATFCIEGKDLVLREYCNLHGLWKG